MTSVCGVSTTELRARWEGCLQVTALPTTFIPPTRERSQLRCSTHPTESSVAARAQVYEVLKPVLLEKEKAEAHLVSNKDKIEFVIIRPGGLKSEPATGRGVLTTDTSVCGSITRGDVADLVRVPTSSC